MVKKLHREAQTTEEDGRQAVEINLEGKTSSFLNYSLNLL